jgi:GxxExxY protein
MQPGLLESAYEGALVIEFQQQGLVIERQSAYHVHYKGQLAGAYVGDLVVAGIIILELISVYSLNSVMEAQLLNYLRLSKVQVGYLVNFNSEKVVWRRFVYGGR